MQLCGTWLHEAHGDWLELLGAHNFQLEKADCMTLRLPMSVQRCMQVSCSVEGGSKRVLQYNLLRRFNFDAGGDNGHCLS